MHIQFLGTGAADFSPLLKTTCREALDRNARRSSAIVIEGRYLIDCGPHVADSLRIQGLDAGAVTDLLVTHFHSDHFDRENAARIAAQTAQPLRIWHRAGAKPEPIEHTVFCPVEPGQHFQAGALECVALAANHTEFPLHYDLEWNGTRLFYGCDGAWVLNETFYAMRHRNYDCMILDGTVGDYNGDFRLGEHNSIPMIRLMAASFRNEQVIAPEGQLWLSHIARTLHEPHDKLSALLESEGMHAAFDGLELTVGESV